MPKNPHSSSGPKVPFWLIDTSDNRCPFYVTYEECSIEKGRVNIFQPFEAYKAFSGAKRDKDKDILTYPNLYLGVQC